MDSLMCEQIADKSRWLMPAARVFSALETGALRSAAGALCVCPALADEARRRAPETPVALLPDMPLFDADHQQPLPEIAQIPGVKLVYVGNLEAYQGVDLMVRAFSLVAADIPAATLVIVGGDGAGRAAERLRAIAPGLCGQGRVRFLGPRPLNSLGAVLAAADILVSPRCAGRNTPMKLYSYLESGRPVIATRLPTHTQVLSDGDAVLVDPDAPSLAAAMRRLLESPELRQRIGSAGQRLVRREYGPGSFRARLRAFYAEIERSIGSAQMKGSPVPAAEGGGA